MITANIASRASVGIAVTAGHDGRNHRHLDANHRQREQQRAERLAEQRREGFGVAHYRQRRQQYRGEEPERNERHPTGIRQVDKPVSTEVEEQGQR